VRGLNQPGKSLSVGHLIRVNQLDFVGIMETKKEDFHTSFLKNLSCSVDFVWQSLPTKGIAGGILVGVKKETLLVSNVSTHQYAICCMIQDQISSFR
jgi:hypothetical protein